jgi:predicted ABC-type transport system involved in lysophospholipase L1 biosynthesis ATPase subunit
MFDLVAEVGAALVMVTHDPTWPSAPTGSCGWPTGASLREIDS